MPISFPKPYNFQSLKGLRVLVVDDNADNLLLLKAILEEYELQVITATSVDEALAAIVRVKPNILISDIVMPHKDGYSLIRQIRNLSTEQLRQLPAIALTGCATQEASFLALDAGFEMYETKPIDPDKLVAAIAYLAASTLTINTCH